MEISHVGEAEREIGEQFAEHQFAGPHGRGEQLLHGAVFPFARDGERTEHGRDDHHGDGDQSGNDKVLGFQIAVVPDADAGIDGNAQRLAAALYLGIGAQLRGVAFDHGVGISERDGCGIGIAAIDQQLDVGFIAREQVSRVVARHDEAQQHGALIDAAIGGLIR